MFRSAAPEVEVSMSRDEFRDGPSASALACSWHLAPPGAAENLEIAQSTLRLDSDDEIDETRPVTLAQIPTK